MQHVGQHYVLGAVSGLCAAPCDEPNTITAFAAMVGHGDGGALFRVRLDAHPQPDGSRINVTCKPLQVDRVAASVFASGDAVVAAHTSGEVSIMSRLSSDSVAVTSCGSNSHIDDATDATAMIDNRAIFATARGEIGIVDSAAAVVTQFTSLAGLAGIPFRCVEAATPSTIVVTAQHVVAAVDLRAPMRVAAAWRWNPQEEFRCADTRGLHLVCGTDEGRVVSFDWREPSVAASSAIGELASPLASLRMFDESCFVTAAANGTMRLWRATAQGEGLFPFSPVKFYPQVNQLDGAFGSTSGVVAACAVPSSGIMLTGDDSGMIEMFAL